MESIAMKENPEPTADEKMVKAKKLLLIVGIVSIIMFFAGLTSMHIVSRGSAAFWVNITTPNAFWWSTALIFLSCFTMFIAVRAVRADNKKLLNGMLILSFILGLAFVQSQLNGWADMAEKGLHMRGDVLEALNGEYGKDYYITNQAGVMVEYRDGHYFDPNDPTGTKQIDEEVIGYRNPSSRNLVVLTGLHVLHVGGGILWLMYLVVLGLFGKLGSRNSLKVTQGAVYWHFVGLLWIYLLLFLHFIH